MRTSCEPLGDGPKCRRQCGPVVRALPLRSGDPGFKTRVDHSLVRVLDSGSSGPGSGRGWGHCVVFLGKTLLILSRCLSPPRCINGYWQNAGGNPAMD